MNPLDLLKTAEVLLSSSKGKPTMVSLRRAVSSIYYALFHCLARECANLLIGGTGADRSKPAWRQVYRSLEHGYARSQCKNQATLKKFPKEIEDFANHFIAMQIKRHDADYDPEKSFSKSEVWSDFRTTKSIITSFRMASTRDRRAFCAYVLLKERKS